MTVLRLLCPEYRLPGATMPEKWAAASTMGFDGIEVAGPASSVRDRRAELDAALRAGAALPIVSSGGAPFVGDEDPTRRRSAIDNLRVLLSEIAELGGLGVTTPASFASYSRALPPLRPPAEVVAHGRAALVDALGEVGEHAKAAGVLLLLEPLNRYEDYLLNTLAHAAAVIDEVGCDAVRILADVFHMQMEEADLGDAVREVGQYVRHVHLADSNRLEPGRGHLDFRSMFRGLRDVGYADYCALECSLTADAWSVLPDVTKLLRRLWDES